MERKRPKVQNGIDKPVNIYRGEELIKECPSIQAAARFFKKEIGANKFNWSAIHNGIWFDKSYSINGATYFFLTAEELVKEKLEELKAKPRDSH